MKLIYFMLACDCIIPIMMIGLGLIMWKKVAKNRNSVYGYRTPMSTKNNDTWRFAHEMAGKIWVKAGIITLIPSILIHIPLAKLSDQELGNATIIICIIQIGILIMSIMPVEKKLRETFDQLGNRK